ncbi:MAG: translation initiation factor IF-2 [Gammaproteobacteria bacterium]|nr:translation initiation factor IF-2 [Gammaproteobacteria bacterium]MCY4255907.1 translation initiation factor IF-2 [Gammaproteobacteria bacterium]
MTELTVAKLAENLKVPVEHLMDQLQRAGHSFNDASQPVPDVAREELLAFLRNRHGQSPAEPGDSAVPREISITRRESVEVVQVDQGRRRAVQVDFRRKRKFVNRAALEREALARRQEEEARRQEEEGLAAKEAEEEEEERRLAEEKAREEQVLAEREAERKAEQEAQEKAEQEAERAKAQEQARLQREEAERQAEEKKRAEAAQAARAREDAARKPPRASKTARSRKTPPREELHVASHIRPRRSRRRKARRHATATVENVNAFVRPASPVVRTVEVPESITVSELARQMAVGAEKVIEKLMAEGVMAGINDMLDQTTAMIIVEALGHQVVAHDEQDEEVSLVGRAVATAGEPEPRDPVVTIMGHVDHGKTSLLDYLRESSVVDGEAGGITQHIGAYRVRAGGGSITFLDTPGHAAFTAMRARGARLTDIVILVIAADDGVKPQTEEAIKHAQAAGVPIVVAINKIDLEDADATQVRNQLNVLGLAPEDYGGDTQVAEVSARTGQGVAELLEKVLLQAELLELRAPNKGGARGAVVESTIETGRGPVTTLLITQGRLRKGDILVAGAEYGRVQSLRNEHGKQVDHALPSFPIVVQGLSGAPDAGQDAVVFRNERSARELAEFRARADREKQLAQKQGQPGFSGAFPADDETRTVALLIKADVRGSVEALRDALMRLAREEVEVEVISSGVGGITESDINLAAASDASIIGFNVRMDPAAQQARKASAVEVRYYSVIYEVIDDVQEVIKGHLAPVIREQIIGNAEVREVFQSPKFGDIAGCLVTEGVVKRHNPIRVLRDSVVIYEGELESLRRFKDDVEQVRGGTECGIGVRNYKNVRAGDVIECYENVEEARD